MNQFVGTNHLHSVKLAGHAVDVRNIEINLTRSEKAGIEGTIEVVCRDLELQATLNEFLNCSTPINVEIYWKDGTEIVCNSYVKEWKKDIWLHLFLTPISPVIALRLDRDVEPVEGYDTGAPFSGRFL